MYQCDERRIVIVYTFIFFNIVYSCSPRRTQMGVEKWRALYIKYIALKEAKFHMNFMDIDTLTATP